MSWLPDLERGRRFVRQQAGLDPLLVAVTGAHYYGFPSPDSDLDLKGVHEAPVDRILSLSPPPDTVQASGTFEGQEMDLTTHELAFALRLLLKGNGNILERLASPYQLFSSPEQGRLVQLGKKAAARCFYGHYRGFFAKKRKECLESRTVKGVLYAYRSALTGIHLLRTGECIGDVTQLAPIYGFSEVERLVASKRAGTEKGEIDSPERAGPDFDRLEQLLIRSHERCELPDTPPIEAEASLFLVSLRRARLADHEPGY
ncbi:MAG: nucleotidyltransferase domain-containing protein [Candidatus Riflebacteria bacterium]|nr:nucleotidyltransferase domain-containing protein [Candidatus Riflebacteria bacterium]